MYHDFKFASVQDLIAPTLAILRPPPDITIAQWADEFRYLSSESSASPGRFHMDRTEFMREPHEMVGKAGVRRVVLMTSAQVAKSTFVENVIGYFMDLDPCPMLHVSPTLDSMKMFSKERLAPMVRDTPVLRGKVKDPRARDSGNTIASKLFPGGHLAMVGANAPAGLASRPIRGVLADEVDRFEASAGTEGDPISLAIKRTTTYWNRFVVMVSTPGDKATSRIEPEFLRGDQRYFWAKCPHCDEFQRLRWSSVTFQDDDPESAHYVCEHNGCIWDDNDRNAAVRAGHWRAEKPFNGVVSYHLSQLYSPFARLADGVREFLDARGNIQLLKTWVNTFLGETWEDKGERLMWSDLLDHREDYDVPDEITVITAAVDMQDDRAEIEWCGWGDDFQSWSLDYVKVYGDPSTPEFWVNLKNTLTRDFEHPTFGQMSPRSIAVDSGGHYTSHVYAFTQAMPKTVAIKGVPGSGKPMVGRPMKNTIGGATVIPLGVDTIKETIAANLRVHDATAAGYCHFPAEYGNEYFKGLTAEELKTKFHKGFKKQEWEKRPGARNEPWDLRVYNRAALEMLQIDLNSLRRQMLHEARKRDSQPVKKPAPAPVRNKNFAQSWRND